MKSIIVYYSYSGNTRKVVEALVEPLRQKGQVEIIELKALDEPNKFLGQCSRAFRHKKADIASVNFDLSVYDAVFLGSPVWAFGPAPAVNTFLERCSGVAGKEVILFTTYGSGMGNKRCLDYMQSMLAQKGAVRFRRFSVQQMKSGNRDFVLQAIKHAVS